MLYIVIAVVIGIILVIGFSAMGIYNQLIALNQNVDTAWANIDVILKQRHDEIPKLISVCEGYKQFERSTLEAVVKARSQYISASSPDDKAAAAGKLSGALRGLFAVAESYPDLKTNQNFIQLQQRVSGLESQIAAQRETYNGTVNALNIGIQQFPAMFIARLLNFHPRTFFQIPDSDKEEVKIAFS